MGKSKKRGGAKAHRKRVQARNQNIKGAQRQMEKMWQDQMMKQMESLRELSGKTQEDMVVEGKTTKIDMGAVSAPNEDENTPLEIKL
jgi:t-SNARE complex subunit (syntaxin)